MRRRQRSIPQRRALSQVHGPVRESGDRAIAARLAAAWHAATGDGNDLTHGIHAWPARAHPSLVRSLIASFCREGGVVLDPFLGSGTVVVEALAGRRLGVGFDVHPVAVRIAVAKTRRLDGDARRELEATAASISRRTLDGDEDDDDPSTPSTAREWFTPGVWRELTTLCLRIDRVRRAEPRFLLGQVLSSILIKVSRRAAETDQRRGQGAPPGLASRLLRDRTTELCLGMAALRRAAAATPAPLIATADARELPLASGSVDLVITSPPYLGTYDYAEMNGLRAQLLGLDLSQAIRRELGTRRRADAAPDAEQRRYHDDLAAALQEMRRVLRPDGLALILIGDSSVRGRMIAADELLAGEAARAGLTVLANAAQQRPATVRGTERQVARQGRHEHLMALRRR